MFWVQILDILLCCCLWVLCAGPVGVEKVFFSQNWYLVRWIETLHLSLLLTADQRVQLKTTPLISCYVEMWTAWINVNRERRCVKTEPVGFWRAVEPWPRGTHQPLLTMLFWLPWRQLCKTNVIGWRLRFVKIRKSYFCPITLLHGATPTTSNLPPTAWHLWQSDRHWAGSCHSWTILCIHYIAPSPGRGATSATGRSHCPAPRTHWGSHSSPTHCGSSAPPEGP